MIKGFLSFMLLWQAEEEKENVVFVVGDNCDVGLDEAVAPISDSSPSGCGRQWLLFRMPEGGRLRVVTFVT